MGTWECFWGPCNFLVGVYQDGLHFAYPDLTPGLQNLIRETNPQPLLLLGLDLGSEPRNLKMEVATEHSEVATEHSETPASCKAPAQAGDGMMAGSPC